MARRVLITGGAGFFGEVLAAHLLERGDACVSVDLLRGRLCHPNLVSVQADVRDREALDAVFGAHRFDAVFHCAAILAHATRNRAELWSANVDGTANVADLADAWRVPTVVFISSNCLWADPFDRPVTEDDRPRPREIYGRSKLEAERLLLARRDRFRTIILRAPTIVGPGRLGLLAILFEFILEGRRVWVVGDGGNRYQFVYARDLADACVRAMESDVEGIFNVGSDPVEPLRVVYQKVIDRAGTAARVASLPRWPTLPMMRLAYGLGLSPLGPYQYRMIAESFEFDTSKIRATLGWRPTRTNSEMLYEAFDSYRRHRAELSRERDLSAHQEPADMGIIRVLKWMS